MLCCPKIVFKIFLSAVQHEYSFLQFVAENGYQHYVIGRNICTFWFTCLALEYLYSFRPVEQKCCSFSLVPPTTPKHSALCQLECRFYLSKLVQFTKPEDNYSCCCQVRFLLIQYSESACGQAKPGQDAILATASLQISAQ